MSRMFTIVSSVVHGVVITSVLAAQLLAVGTLPTPRRPLSFQGAMPVRIVDIPLPAPSRGMKRAGAAPAVSDAQAVAPIVAPNGVQPDTGVPSIGDSPTPLNGVEAGFSSAVGLTPIENVPPPPAPPQTPIPLHQGMQAPRKIVNADPIYPRTAQQAHIEGVVIIETIIDVQGRVSSARVLRSLPMLDQAEMDAVRQWTFTPARLNGVAVPVVMTVTVTFTLNQR